MLNKHLLTKPLPLKHRLQPPKMELQPNNILSLLLSKILLSSLPSDTHRSMSSAILSSHVFPLWRVHGFLIYLFPEFTLGKNLDPPCLPPLRAPGSCTCRSSASVAPIVCTLTFSSLPLHPSSVCPTHAWPSQRKEGVPSKSPRENKDCCKGGKI